MYRTITAARPAPAAHDPGPPVRMSSGQPVNADDSAKTRDLLAGDRTLLAWIRTALAFAGLGFAVAKFGRTPDLIRTAGYLGIALTLAGLLITISGYVQYRTMLTKEEPPPGTPVPSPWPPFMAAASCALACARSSPPTSPSAPERRRKHTTMVVTNLLPGRRPPIRR